MHCESLGKKAEVNSLMAADDLGKPWLSVKNFLVAGIPTTMTLALLLVTAGATEKCFASNFS